jgi:hypothetical protein
MQRLELPRVTLFAIDTACHDLTRLVMDELVEQIAFGDAIVFTDRPEVFEGYETVRCEPFTDRAGLSAVSRDVWKHVRTSHCLQVHWDAGMVDVDAWRPEFLDYDYVGAPWGWFPDKNVGCSGFVLRSRRFLEIVSTRLDIVTATATAVDDEPICRALRPRLETAEGLKWAPENVALDFAFERVRRSAKTKHFGYHGTFNWPFVHDADSLARRLGLAMKVPYIAERGMLNELFRLLAFLYDPARKTEFKWISPPWD